MISSDLENAQIAQMSLGIIPRALIIRNHPWDPYETEKMLEQEKKEDEKVYPNFPLENNSTGDGNEK